MGRFCLFKECLHVVASVRELHYPRLQRFLPISLVPTSSSAMPLLGVSGIARHFAVSPAHHRHQLSQGQYNAKLPNGADGIKGVP